MISDLKRVIDQVSREKGVEQNVLIEALEEAVKAAARKKFGPDYDLEVRYNEDVGEIEAFEFKEVVEEVTNKNLQISLKDAHEMDPESEVGDSLGVKMDTDTFGRIAAQSAKQVIMQRLKEAERDMVYEDFKDRRGEERADAEGVLQTGRSNQGVYLGDKTVQSRASDYTFQDPSKFLGNPI